MRQQQSTLEIEKIQLIGINIRSFCIQNNIENKSPEEIREHLEQSAHTSYHLKHGIDVENKAIGFEINIKIDPSLAADTVGALSLTASVFAHFRVENLSDFIIIDDKNKNITINRELAVLLVDIAFSTFRGILFERTSNTPFAGLILPIIRPDSLLKGFKQN
jgi:hypothetical protein